MLGTVTLQRIPPVAARRHPLRRVITRPRPVAEVNDAHIVGTSRRRNPADPLSGGAAQCSCRDSSSPGSSGSVSHKTHLDGLRSPMHASRRLQNRHRRRPSCPLARAASFLRLPDSPRDSRWLHKAWQAAPPLPQWVPTTSSMSWSRVARYSIPVKTSGESATLVFASASSRHLTLIFQPTKHSACSAASGKLVTPGLIDLHAPCFPLRFCHRHPGR